MKKSCYSIKLYNGVTIPATGYGTYKEAVSDETVKAIEQALKAGYRHIDTASRYGNEKCVGDAIKNSKIARNDIFVTTKLWNDKQGYNSTIKALNASLKELGFKYADLFLIHWPVSLGKEKQWKELNNQTWKAFEYLYKQKKIRAIGVSNFEIKHLKNILKHCTIKPMVNQIEMHPGVNNKKLLKFCKKNNIVVEAYAPLAQGRIKDDPIVNTIAKEMNKTAAQVSLRWCLQHNVIPLAKSMHTDRIKNNFDIFNFNLTDKQMRKIDKDKFIKRLFPSPNKGK